MVCLVSLSVILHIKNCRDCVFHGIELNLFSYINTFSTSNSLQASAIGFSILMHWIGIYPVDSNIHLEQPGFS